MPLSCLIDGKVQDWRFKKFNIYEDGYNCYFFFVGDKYYGQIHDSPQGWVAIPNVPFSVAPVYGFKSRYYAAQYILKVHGLGD